MQVRSSQMGHVSALFAVKLLLFIYSTEGFQIPECGTDGYVNVTEFTESKLTCQGLSQGTDDGILWLIVQDGRETQIASCGPFSCNMLDNSGNFSVKPSSVSNSVELTIKQSHRQMDGATLRCSNNTGVLSEPAECKLRLIWVGTSTSAGIPFQSTNPISVTAIGHTTQLQSLNTGRTTTVDTTSLTTKDKDDDKPSQWAAIGGGLGAAVVIIIVIVIVIVIVKRRLVSRKSGGDNRKGGTYKYAVDEHVNVVYEPGGQEDNNTSTARHQPAINTTIAPSYDDYHLDNGEVSMGYTTVDLNPPAHKRVNRSAPGNVGMTHTNSVPAIRHYLALDETEMTDECEPNYSAVNAPRPKTFAAPSLTSTHGDEYAVADKRTKGKKSATFQPEVYAQVHKPKPNTAEDVYAKVDKSSKRGNSQVVQQNVDSGDGGYYAEVRKPIPGNKPTLSVKPVLKPKPTQQPKSAANPGDGQAELDEYNALQFGSPSQNLSPGEGEQQYSHISMV